MLFCQGSAFCVTRPTISRGPEPFVAGPVPRAIHLAPRPIPIREPVPPASRGPCAAGPSSKSDPQSRGPQLRPAYPTLPAADFQFHPHAIHPILRAPLPSACYPFGSATAYSSDVAGPSSDPYQPCRVRAPSSHPRAIVWRREPNSHPYIYHPASQNTCLPSNSMHSPSSRENPIDFYMRD